MTKAEIWLVVHSYISIVYFSINSTNSSLLTKFVSHLSQILNTASRQVINFFPINCYRIGSKYSKYLGRSFLCLLRILTILSSFGLP